MGATKKILKTIQIKDCVFFFACIIISYVIKIGHDVFLYHDNSKAFIYYIGGLYGAIPFYAIIYFIYLVTLTITINNSSGNYLLFTILFSCIYFFLLKTTVINYVSRTEEFDNSNIVGFFPFSKYFTFYFIIVSIVQIDINIILKHRNRPQ